MTARSTEQEQDFQQAVLELAQLAGWRRAHFRPARTKHGWRTPVAADGAGFPDLILIRPGRLVVAELKSDVAYGKKGKPTLQQQVWLDAFASVDGVEVHVWRPRDWDLIVRTLTGKRLRQPRAQHRIGGAGLRSEAEDQEAVSTALGDSAANSPARSASSTQEWLDAQHEPDHPREVENKASVDRRGGTR